MTRLEYQESKLLRGVPFYALIMAAMRQADTRNADALRSAFPAVWAELQARYNAPCGLLTGERVSESALERYDGA